MCFNKLVITFKFSLTYSFGLRERVNLLIYLVVNVFVVVVVYESVCLSLVWCDRVRCGVAWFDVLWFCVVCELCASRVSNFCVWFLCRLCRPPP